jgi:transposase InsO family protein
VVSKARLVITAVVVEQRSPSEVARAYGVSRSWIYELVARYRIEGDAAFEPRSRRPRTRPRATPTEIIDRVLALRRELTAEGLDAGADTIRWHLQHHHQLRLSRATIYRIVRRAELVTPDPAKKPRSSYVRFQAELPNECWQSDFTHWRLADGTDIEILTWLDDHSRYLLSVTAHPAVTGQIVVTTFRTAIDHHGPPASTLTDNGLVYTTRFSQGGKTGKTSKNGFENELAHRGIRQKNSRPNHPTTCGKVERVQQTMKHWLATQPRARTLTELRRQLDTFVETYNHHRPHRAHTPPVTPAAAYHARPKATPTTSTTSTGEHRVRHDRINNGRITIRIDGHLHKIALGRPLDGTRVIALIHGHDIRVIQATTGEIIRTLTIDPTRRYHGTGKPPGGPRRPYGTRKTTRPEPQ